MRRVLPALLAAGVLGSAAACETERAITTEPAARAYGILLALSPTNLPRGTARIPKPTQTPSLTLDTIRLTLTGLDSLENGHYTVWAGDSTATPAFKRLRGNLIVVRTDTVINALGDPEPRPVTTTFTGVSSFQNGGPRHRMTFVATRASAGLTVADSIKTVLISIEASADATAPAETRRPLWARRAEGTDSTVASINAGRRFSGAPIRFGNFHARPESSYVYVATGNGRVLVRDDVMIINDSSLTRPPLGYYYAAYAVRRDSASTWVDTVYLGPQTSPFPERKSLQNADSVLISEMVQTLVLPPNLAGTWSSASPSAILAASTRVSADTVAGLRDGGRNFRGIGLVFVTLESKHKDPQRLGPAIVLRAELPGIVQAGLP